MQVLIGIVIFLGIVIFISQYWVWILIIIGSIVGGIILLAIVVALVKRIINSKQTNDESNYDANNYYSNISEKTYRTNSTPYPASPIPHPTSSLQISDNQYTNETVTTEFWRINKFKKSPKNTWIKLYANKEIYIIVANWTVKYSNNEPSIVKISLNKNYKHAIHKIYWQNPHDPNDFQSEKTNNYLDFFDLKLILKENDEFF